MSGLLLSLLTAKVLPLVVPPFVALVRTFVAEKVPSKYVPLLLALGGALVDVVATMLGVQGIPADLWMLGTAAWEGALVALAATGVHQVYKQLKSPGEPAKP